ncbi:MAG: S9 family peptidase [Planctomycetota bacterium]|jgi:dipeptidyl aminopeptidase/acylaminoacyl peptidase
MATKKRKRRITPEDLNRFQLVGSPRISPDGTRIVFVRKHLAEKPKAYASQLWMVDVDDGEPAAYTSGTRDSHPRWSPDGERIAFIRGDENGGAQICVIGASGGEAQTLTDFPEGKIGDFKWSPDGKLIALRYRAQSPDWTKQAKDDRKEQHLSEPPLVVDDWWYRLDGDGYFGAQRHHLYLVDTSTGEHRRVYDRDTIGFFTYDFSPDSKKLAITTNRDRKAMIKPGKDEILILTISSGKTRAVPNLPEGPKDSVAWSPDGRLLAYAGRVGNDYTYSTENLELWTCEPTKGNAKALTKKEDFCLMACALTDTAEISFAPSIQWSPGSRRIYIKIGHHGETHLASVAARGGRIQFHTSGARDVDPGNFSDDGKRLALVVATATKLGEVHVGDRKAAEVRTRAVTNLNGAWHDEVLSAPITSAWVRTADGTKVHTWAMFPPGHKKSSRKKYPAVLQIHGGPHAQYGVGFFHEFQVLAAAGYAVFFSNPRGSKGYGRDHCHAIHGSWGDADWVDIQAVTSHMQDHPNVDAKRLGIMGGSYGGYMTNWAIGQCRDFAGAITDRCVSNVHTMGGTSDFIEAPDHYFPGNWWDRPEARWEQSPIKYIGNCRTPTLIIHSEGDLRCNIEQAEQVFAALKLLNVPTRFVRYPKSTSHGMSRSGPPDLRVHRLHQVLDWWGKYLKK